MRAGVTIVVAVLLSLTGNVLTKDCADGSDTCKAVDEPKPHKRGRPARVPKTDEWVSYAQSAVKWSERAKFHMTDTSNRIEMEQSAKFLKRALFHAPHHPGLWRNLGLTLGKVAQHHMENKGNYRIARENMQEAAAAYRMASYFGDSAAQQAHDTMKNDIFRNYYGASACIDPLDPNCDTLEDVLSALESIRDPSTAAEGVRWLCNSADSVKISIRDEEKEQGYISVATLERANAILKVCGVVVIEDAIPESKQNILDEIKAHYADKTREQMDELEGQPGVQGRGEGRWEVTMPLEEPFISDALIASPYILPIIKSFLQTAHIEIDTFGNILSFPQSGPQEWHRDTADIYTLHMDNQTIMNRNPPHGLVMTVPLNNLKLNHGPTEFSMGSHMAADMFGPVGMQTHWKKLPRVKLPMKKGSVCIFDIRTQHQGTPNNGKKSIRQLLYISYVNQWYTDTINDNQPFSAGFDQLPSVVHQKLLKRQDARQYIQQLEYKLHLQGVKVSDIKSKYVFERDEMEA